jgi:drug/metabolite transporter (DMT)-like permease
MITIGAFFGTFIGLLLMSVSVKYAPAGIAAAIGSTYPVWVLVVERIFLKKASGPLRIICTVVAVLGVCLMMVPRL